MKKLHHTQTVPYGGQYVINRSDLGFVGSGSTFDMLENSVKAYRKANGIPIGIGFLQELESAVCDLYPAECEESDPNLPPDRPRRLRLNDVIVGSKTMLNFWLAGNPIVSQEEMERRVNICVSCKYNVQFPKSCGGGCGELKELVLSIVGNRATPRSSELNSCAICACFLEAAVWLPVDIQVKALSDAQRAQFSHVPWCWKKIG
jgi:hypothetical protein